MRKLNHIGIPTQQTQANENYLDGLKVWITDYQNSDNRIEYLRFEEGSPMHELIQNMPHLAYEVPSMEEAIAGKKILLEPMPGGENLTIAFIEEEGIAVELMQFHA